MPSFLWSLFRKWSGEYIVWGRKITIKCKIANDVEKYKWQNAGSCYVYSYEFYALYMGFHSNAGVGIWLHMFIKSFPEGKFLSYVHSSQWHCHNRCVSSWPTVSFVPGSRPSIPSPYIVCVAVIHAVGHMDELKIGKSIFDCMVYLVHTFLRIPSNICSISTCMFITSIEAGGQDILL